MSFKHRYFLDKLFQLLDYIDVDNVTVIDVDGKYVCHGTMKMYDKKVCTVFRHDSGAVYNNFTMREVKDVCIDMETLNVQVQLNFSK